MSNREIKALLHSLVEGMVEEGKTVKIGNRSFMDYYWAYDHAPDVFYLGTRMKQGGIMHKLQTPPYELFRSLWKQEGESFVEELKGIEID